MNSLDNYKQAYETFKKATGNTATRLRISGFMTAPSAGDEKETTVESLEDFAKIASQGVSREVFTRQLRKIYKHSVSLLELKSILRMGDTGLSATEVEEACRLLPFEDSAVLLPDLLDFLYQ